MMDDNPFAPSQAEDDIRTPVSHPRRWARQAVLGIFLWCALWFAVLFLLTWLIS